MKRLSKDQKASIRLAVRDAMFQELADREEDIDHCAYDEIEKILERQGFDVDSVVLNEFISKEMRWIFARMYEATKKGEED